jgi:hypothetical protein
MIKLFTGCLENCKYFATNAFAPQANTAAAAMAIVNHICNIFWLTDSAGSHRWISYARKRNKINIAGCRLD